MIGVEAVKNWRGVLTQLLPHKTAAVFVFVNVFVSLVSFARSVAFMRILDLHELGTVTLIQTGAIAVGFLQVGVINGGYRMLSLQKEDQTRRLHNAIYSSWAVLAIVLLLAFLTGMFSGVFSDGLNIGISLLIGLALLMSNWVSNALIAKRDYSRLNKANMFSSFASIAFLPAAHYWGVLGAISSIFVQPLCLVLMVVLSGKGERPTRFEIDSGTIRETLKVGFIPYLSGLLMLVYMQAERWSIASFIGTADLGKFYLVFLMTSVWILLPTSINSLLFPRAVKLYADGSTKEFLRIMRNYSVGSFVYCLGASLVVGLTLSAVVGLIAPQHQPFVKYAYMAIPGLAFRTLSDPVVLVFNSVLKLKPIFVSDIFSLGLFSVLVVVALLLKVYSLEWAITCLNGYYVGKFASLLLSLWRLRRDMSFAS